MRIVNVATNVGESGRESALGISDLSVLVFKGMQCPAARRREKWCRRKLRWEWSARVYIGSIILVRMWGLSGSEGA